MLVPNFQVAHRDGHRAALAGNRVALPGHQATLAGQVVSIFLIFSKFLHFESTLISESICKQPESARDGSPAAVLVEVGLAKAGNHREA